MTDSFEDYAEGRGLVTQTVGARDFFEKHPDLLEEVLRIREDGWAWHDIQAWLRDQHGFAPKSPTSIRMYLLKIDRL